MSMERTTPPTPGPWHFGDERVMDEQAELVVRQIEYGKYVVAYTPSGASPERLANARLIVNAPRMLELLTTALDLMALDDYNSRFGQEVRSLLCDVEGVDDEEPAES